MRTLTLTSADIRLSVSALCLGTMYMDTKTDEKTSFAILDRYCEAGGNFLDTANNHNYSFGGHGRESEDVIGRWLASRSLAGEVHIATKADAANKNPNLPLANAEVTNFQGLAPRVVRAKAEESLRLIGVERLDVYYGHVDDRDLPIEEILRNSRARRRNKPRRKRGLRPTPPGSNSPLGPRCRPAQADARSKRSVSPLAPPIHTSWQAAAISSRPSTTLPKTLPGTQPWSPLMSRLFRP